MKKNRSLKIFIWILLAGAALYGLGRLYFQVTAGFTLSNITSDLAPEERWNITLDPEQKEQVKRALAQRYTYLGKGCQSYVFLSEDGDYVIKFFKYQRFRPQAWLSFFDFIPAVESYREGKIVQKQKKLENLFSSWKLAFEELQPETGLVFIHLNKSQDLNKEVLIVDKIGFEHRLDIDNYEFLIQRRAEMLTKTLDAMMLSGEKENAKALLDNLLNRILSEYRRGLGDNDHALMQNTGVLEGMPVHIDVGQFVRNENFKDPKVYKQELFNKTYKFRIWLKKHHPELGAYLDSRLQEIIGPEMQTLKPHLKNMACDEL